MNYIIELLTSQLPFCCLQARNKADKSASNSLNPSIFEGLVTLCAPDAVCFSRHIPHASGRILAERFYVIGTLRSNFLLHKKSVSGLSPETDFFIAYFFSDQISVLFASETFFYKNYNCYDCCQKNNHEWKNRCIISCLNCSLSCRI